MSNSSWIKELTKILKTNPVHPLPLNKLQPQRIAFIGIGNELNGDDAAGVLVVRVLARLLQNLQRHKEPGDNPLDLCVSVQYQPMPTTYQQADGIELMLIEGGIAPEAFGGPLRRFKPDWVVMIDAAAMDEEAGHIEWVDWRQADGLSATTHTMPPTMLAKYLIHELGCQVGLIGIQPACVEMDMPLDLRVAIAVGDVAGGIYDITLGEAQSGIST